MEFFWRLIDICLIDEYLQRKWRPILSAFDKMNRYPLWLIQKFLKIIKEQQSNQWSVFQKPNKHDKKVNLFTLLSQEEG